MANKEYVEKNRKWLEDKSREDGVTSLEKGVMYKVIKVGDSNSPSPGPGSVVTVHYVGNFRQQPWGSCPCIQASRPYLRLDDCPSENACRRRVGDIHTCRTGLWQIQPARHTGRIDTCIRD